MRGGYSRRRLIENSTSKGGGLIREGGLIELLQYYIFISKFRQSDLAKGSCELRLVLAGVS